jgi:GntR family transcriptional regulator
MTSAMLDVKIDRDDPALLHEQVAAQIRLAIADGEAKPGDRLPPARHLAAVMQVNTNTVLRALRLLRDEGLLELRQGHGIRVVGTPERSALLGRVAELVQLGRQSGITRAELARMIESVPYDQRITRRDARP